MTETEFQIIKSVGFVLALGLALAAQHWRPHRLLAGSWRTNSGLRAPEIDRPLGIMGILVLPARGVFRGR